MSSKEDEPTPQDQFERLKDRIVSDAPRLELDDTFQFGCHPGVACFNQCCGDVNIFLSPYDLLRMKKRLGITSTELLEKYTLLPVHKEMKTPVVMLRMGNDEARSCMFLTDGGCGIYSDRPWPCRMYPIGLAAQKDTADGWRGERFYFLMQETGCWGFKEDSTWTVREWLEDQGVGEYDEWGEAYKELTLNDYFEQGNTLSPEKMHMMYTACYDLDKFREFVFESTLMDRFEMDEDFVEEMRYDDETLLRFAFLWLRFSLFGEPTMKPKPDIIEAFKGKLDKKKLFDKETDEA